MHVNAKHHVTQRMNTLLVICNVTGNGFFNALPLTVIVISDVPRLLSLLTCIVQRSTIILIVIINL